MALKTQGITVGEVVKFEQPNAFSREKLTVLAGNNIVRGQVCRLVGGKAAALADVAAVDDVQTLTMSDGTDGGTFVLRYRGVATAALAWNISAADLQEAVRALHDDLAASVVTTESVGTEYTITTAAKACADLEIQSDLLLDDEVAEPASLVHTTQGAAAVDGGMAAEVVALEAADATDGDVANVIFIVRDAIVLKDNLTYGENITAANADAALKTKGILARAALAVYKTQTT